MAQNAALDCNNAMLLAKASQFCSADHGFSNANNDKTAWFKFAAVGFDVNITVSGAEAGGTLVNPTIQLYSDCQGTELVGSGITESNVTTLYKGGLAIGTMYYLKVAGVNKQTGDFKLCINNYDPIVKPGQDCSTASFLCSLQTISQNKVSGAGLNNNEAKGTCLDVGQPTESNSAWYKWQAANDGTLVFTITPNSVHDDIDWVLYDLGITGDCANVTPANVLRCKAGYGVDNIDCPKDTVYYKTGLDFNETDISEPPGCGKGQNGKLKYITMQQGHIYALLVNNFSSGNNGFTLAFTDQKDNAGTAIFEGPQPVIAYTSPGDCLPAPQFTFTSHSTGYNSLKWSFGDGANIATANTPGPLAVTYTTSGLKTVTLQATGNGGCTVVASQQFEVSIKPLLPVIQADKNVFCTNDTVKLRTINAIPGLTYTWFGPDHFHSDSSVAVIPISGQQTAGIYKLVTADHQCYSDTATFLLNGPALTPIAAFHSDPSSVQAAYGPVTLNLINDSADADSFLWDFGDGTTSNAPNPVHTYSHKGRFNIRLTASKTNACVVSTVKNSLVVILNNSYIFVPNTFTPNGDGINDVFHITITNIKSYHLQIYTSWGQPVFESKEIFNTWDGTYNRKPVVPGVYYFVINAVSIDDEPIRLGGYVTLLR